MTTYGEIYVREADTQTGFDKLTPPERVFVYLISRAILPMVRICRDQNHRHLIRIISHFEDLLQTESDPTLKKDIETYLVYLWTNGIYFRREHTNNKRTPARIGLSLTRENSKLPPDLAETVFDETELTNVVPGDLEKSNNNFYERGFTEEMYSGLDKNIRNQLNVYFTVADPHYIIYSTSGKYASELQIVVTWLNRAAAVVRENPSVFDPHILPSLEKLIAFFETGDEAYYREFFIEWLQTRGRVNYLLGMPEQYADPKSTRGEAGGEVTIQAVDIKDLEPTLVELETRAPIPQKYKRSEFKLNVTFDEQLFAGGHYGPSMITAAYCLPNYEDIREKYGSKQVIYKPPAPIKLDPKLWELFVTNEQLSEDITNMHILLHETVGHASGKLDVNSVHQPSNIAELIGKDYSALEELRAEINALYFSVAEVELLNSKNLYKEWYTKLNHDDLKRACVSIMSAKFLKRLIRQPDSFTEITGAHARANAVICNWLVSQNAIKITSEKKIYDTEYNVLGVEVVNLDRALCAIKELVIKVQTIKSSGDGAGCMELFEYTKKPITIDMARKYRDDLLKIHKKLMGPIQVEARVFLNYQPVFDGEKIIDVYEGPKQTIVEQQLGYSKLMLMV